MSAQADEDTIDLQGLQAQIDLSMSFAQNLVTSWVKPTCFAQTSKRRNLEGELKEYLRRPARLGVGAPVPEAQSLAREAAILKSKLGVRKRQREEGEMEAVNIPSEDDQESRTGAIKQKTRLDLFDGLSKKKKSGAWVDRERSQATHSMGLAPSLQARVTAGDILETGDSLPPLRKKKKKKRLGVNNDTGEQQDKSASTRMPISLVKNQSSANEIESLPTSPQHSKLIKSTDSSLLSPIRSSHPSPTAKHTKFIDVSLTSTPSRSPGHQTINSELLKQPLLNLDGSLSEGNSDDERKSGLSRSPKKKRRRRKKKTQMVLPES